MKKHWKALFGGIAGLCILTGTIAGWIISNHGISILDMNNNQRSVPQEARADKINEDDYVILEIVPDVSYAQLGYLQAGDEPIDIFKACAEGKAEQIQALAGGSTYCKTTDYVTGLEYEDLKETYGEEKVSKYFTQVTTGTAIKSQKRYDFKDNKTFAYIGYKENNALKTTLENVISKYDDVVIETMNAEDLDGISDLKEYLAKVDLVYISDSYLTNEQRELVKEYGKKKELVPDNTVTFTSDKRDLSWSVVEKIFARVGQKEDPLPIIFDNMVYNDALKNAGKSVTTHQYSLNRAVKYAKDKDGKFTYTFSVLGSLLKEEKDWVAGNSQNASNNNVYKLYLMSMFRDPAEFYNLFFESAESTDEKISDKKIIDENGNSKLQSSEDAKKYWNVYSFLPCKGEIDESDSSREKGDETYWKKIDITLEAKTGDWKNACAFSHGSSESFVKMKSNVTSIDKYEPYTAYVTGRTYKVLELEATNCFNEFSLTEAAIEKMLPYTGFTTKDMLNVEIEGMSTATFVSKKNDLTSEYDMVYIGDDVSGFRTSGGKTQFGIKTDNKNLNGVIYSHIGSFVPFNYGTAELTSRIGTDKSNGYALFGDSESGSLRYSGTDITEIRKEDLVDMLKAGMPVIVAKSLYEDVTSGYKKNVGNGTTYNNSKYFSDIDENVIYSFISTNKDAIFSSDFDYHDANEEKYADTSVKVSGVSYPQAAYSALSRITMLRQNMQVKSINTTGEKGSRAVSGYTSFTEKDGKAVLKKESAATTIDYGNSFVGDELKNNCTYGFSSTAKSRQFTFSIAVSNVMDYAKTYSVEIYVDKNADGVYKNSERVKKTNVKLRESGVNVSFNMNPNYTGAFTWKVVVYPTDNPYLTSSQIGYGNIVYSDKENKKKVHVLQVQAMAGAEYHGTTWGEEYQRTINLEDMFKNVVLNDYDITFDDVNLKDFCSSSGWKSDNCYPNTKITRDTIDKYYDMIVFGFADTYRGVEMNKETAKAVQNYISKGFSVMYSHDLTSPSNHSIEDTNRATCGNTYLQDPVSGKGFNKYLRDSMGLNRYKQSVKAIDEYSSDYYTNHQYKMRSNELFYGFTYSVLMQYSNSRHAWKMDSSTTDNDRRKKNNSYLEEEGKEFWGPYKSLYCNLYTQNEGNPGDNNSWSDIAAGYRTNYVSNVNEGQITKYPYDLSSEHKISATKGYGNKYKIAETHGQAYQLNVEDPSVICWYALADDSHTQSNPGWYDSSPNDASNNYYLYNKGNVTYTGMGHRSGLTVFEAKLYINTFIAALRAGVEGPQPEITNGYSISDGNGEKQYIYADIDADSEKEDFAGKENIEFYVTDDSTTSDYVYVTVEVKKEDTYEEIVGGQGFEIVSADGSSVSGPLEVQSEDGKSKHYVWKIKKTNLDSTTVHNYILKFPKSYLKDYAIQDFRLCGYGCKENTEKIGILGYKEASLCRRSFFALD